MQLAAEKIETKVKKIKAISKMKLNRHSDENLTRSDGLVLIDS